jgi:hypothetical protein
MPLDSHYSPKVDGLAARAAAAAETRHVEMQSALAPHQVKRGAVSGKHLKLNDEPHPTPNSGRAKSGASGGRQSRAAETGDGLQMVLDRFVFDYFQGVIPTLSGTASCQVGGPVETKAVADATRFMERNGMRFGAPTSGGRGYANGIGFAFPGEQEAVGFVASGSTGGYMPNVTIKGGRGACALLAPMLQQAFPGIRLTRADACLDVMCGDTGWRDLLKLSRRFAKARDMNRPDIRGLDDPEKGRTFYLGSREASVFVRVYEKGKAENARNEKAGRAGTADPDWVRIEFQFQKVDGRKKAAKGAMTPAELICTHDWPRFWLSMASAELELTDGIERAALHTGEYEPVVKTLDSTADHGARQYGPTFLKLAAREMVENEHGGRVEDAVICPEELEIEASRIFLAKLRESGIAVKYVKEARLHVSETLDERCDAVAEALRDRRVDLMRRQAKDRATLADQIGAGSLDDAGKERLRESAVIASHRANDAAEEART